MSMKRKINRSLSGLGYQRGMTLMELLVAGFISVVVSSGMVVLMASTLGTGTQTIKITRLSQEMRASMQIMTRELRRANYHSTFASCFGDENCRTDLGIDAFVKPVTVDGSGNCFWFWYDRPQDPSDTQIAVTGEEVAGFRWREIGPDSDIGVIEMSVTLATQPDCSGTAASWQAITDPNVYDVESFTVTSTAFTTAIGTTGSTLSTDQIDLAMTAKLVDDGSTPEWISGNSAPTFSLQDFIRIRNDISSL